MNDVLKDKNGNILNPKIPRYERKTTYISGTNQIEFTAEYDCYIDIMLVDTAWGYDGGNVTLSITNNVGNAEEIFNFESVGSQGNVIARSLVARALYECQKGNTYRFARSLQNSGGSNGAFMIGQIFPK